MKTKLIWTGKTADKTLATLIDDYAGRIRHYTALDIVCLPDLRNTKSLSPAQQRDKEGEQLLAQLDRGDLVVLLDEAGRTLRSIEFADYLQKKQQVAARRLVFVIGGAYGFSDAVYQAAADKLSLSAMTFSHQLIRLLFVEQLYRALTILKGEPYHHE